MGEQRNLTEENVTELKSKLDKMAETNPNLEYRFFRQGTEKGQFERLESDIMEIKESIEDITRLIQNIFDGHILLNGKFTKISV